MASRHGSYELGYTRTTMVITMRSKNANFNKSLKITIIRIIDCNSSV
jgi:hypothetical protein